MGLFNRDKPTAPSAVASAVILNLSKAVHGPVVPVVYGAPKRETRPSKAIRETRRVCSAIATIPYRWLARLVFDYIRCHIRRTRQC